MFSVGDKIMYGGTGACVVEEIAQVPGVPEKVEESVWNSLHEQA